MVIYVTFLRGVARQKLLNSANVSRSYSQNNTGTFFETRCTALIKAIGDICCQCNLGLM